MSPKDPQFPPELPRTVEIVTFPEVQLLDVAGPMQVFASANKLLSERGQAARYLVDVVSPAPSVLSTAGLRFETRQLEHGEPLDTLIVAGGQGVMLAAKDTVIVDGVRSRAEMSRRIASVCTGAFLLAATGLLDGRRVATHWNYCQMLADMHPHVRVDPEPIFIQDGEIFTSAGVTAGIDLSLALVEQDLGRSIALGVARELVVFLKRPGGQAQFSSALRLQSVGDQFADLHHWMIENLTEPLTLAQLASRFGVSERSFSRHYKHVTGFTPAKAVERLRIDAARQLLIDSRLSMKRVAAECGFNSEETLRRAFLRHQNILPNEFRARFSNT